MWVSIALTTAILNRNNDSNIYKKSLQCIKLALLILLRQHMMTRSQPWHQQYHRDGQYASRGEPPSDPLVVSYALRSAIEDS